MARNKISNTNGNIFNVKPCVGLKSLYRVVTDLILIISYPLGMWFSHHLRMTEQERGPVSQLMFVYVCVCVVHLSAILCEQLQK